MHGPPCSANSAVLAGPMLQPVLPRLCTSPVYQPALPSVAGARESDGAVEQRAGLGRPRQRKQRAVSRQPSPLTNTQAPPSCSPLGFQTPLALAQTSRASCPGCVQHVEERGVSGSGLRVTVAAPDVGKAEPHSHTSTTGSSTHLSCRDGPRPLPKHLSTVPVAASPTGCQGRNGSSKSCCS